jgi:hypothetical protein
VFLAKLKEIFENILQEACRKNSRKLEFLLDIISFSSGQGSFKFFKIN